MIVGGNAELPDQKAITETTLASAEDPSGRVRGRRKLRLNGNESMQSCISNARLHAKIPIVLGLDRAVNAHGRGKPTGVPLPTVPVAFRKPTFKNPIARVQSSTYNRQNPTIRMYRGLLFFAETASAVCHADPRRPC